MRGGGVAIYTKLHLDASRPLHKLEDRLGGIECLSLKMDNIWITNVYVPPGFKKGYGELHRYSHAVANKVVNKTWIVLGDFNRSNIDWKETNSEPFYERCPRSDTANDFTFLERRD